MWGSATDGRRVYAAVVSGDNVPYTMRSVTGETLVITGGFWAALDAVTGRIIWQTTGTIHWRFPSGGAAVAGGAVVDGTVCWGSGYYYPEGADNDTFYAFSPR